MTAPTTLLLILAMLPVPVDDPDAIAIWYREKYRGELDAAAEHYALVYAGLSPWQGQPRAERTRSALRAGLCYEMRGRRHEAALAYGWLRRGGADAELSELAGFRMRRMLEAFPDGERVGDSLPRSGLEISARRLNVIRSAVDSRITVLRTQVDSASVELHQLEEAGSVARRRLRSVRSLSSDLQRHGAATIAVADSEFDDDLQRRLPEALGVLEGGPADFDALPTVLADALCARGLHALAEGDLTRSEHLLVASTALASDQVIAARFVGWIRSGQPSAAVASLARRALDAERLRLLDALLREVRPLVKRVTSPVGASDRPDRVLARVGQIEEALAWAAPEIRQDPELNALDRECRYLFERQTAGVGPQATLRSLSELRRMHVRMLVDISIDVVEAEIGLLFVGSVIASLDQARWGRVLHGELQARLAGARERERNGDRDGTLTALDQVEMLTDRVRWLDPSGIYRQAGRLLRAELETTSPDGRSG